MRRCLLPLLFLLLPVLLPATAYEVRWITNADGLSNSSANAVFQDSRGRLWIGTWDGLDCWNGSSCKVYKPVSGDSTSISSNIIRDIAEDGEGFLWIATERGVDRLDPETGRFRRYFTEAAMRVNTESAFHIYCTPEAVYAGVDRGGIYRFEDGRFQIMQGYPWPIDSFRVEDGVPLVRTQDGRCFRGQQACASIPSLSQRPSVQTPYGLCTAGGDGIVLQTDEGPQTLLPGIPVLSLCMGTQDILWAGTDMHGVALITPERNLFPCVKGVFDGSAVRCLMEDREGLLFVGTKGAGIFCFTPDGRLSRRYTQKDGLLSDAVYVMADDGEAIWIGTEGNGLNYATKDRHGIHHLVIPPQMLGEVDLTAVYAICPEAPGVLWVGTSGHGLYRLVIQQGTLSAYEHYDAGSLGSDIVYSVLVDGGQVWVGTRGGGLWCLHRENGTFTSVPAAYDVTCLAKASDGALLAGSSVGLFRFGPDGRMSHYDEQLGLPNNTIHGILEDDGHNIWVSTNNGLARIRLSDGTLVSWFKEDGLQDNEFSDGAFYRSPRSGELFFGGLAGLNRFHAGDIPVSDYFPPVALDAFQINNRETVLQDHIRDGRLRLLHDRGSISFRFVPLDYLNRQRCDLAYRLDGQDRGWIALGKSNTIVFSNLSPGSYTLHVRCTNEDGFWGPEEYVLPIRIVPRWYESPWAYLAYALLLAASLWGLYLQKRDRDRARARILEDELAQQKMEEVHEAKLQFFTHIAHEFSNSLTLIYGPCAELYNDTRMTPQQRHYLSVIAANSDRMQSLIQQLILFRKAETGHLSVHIEPVDVAELVRFESDYFLERMQQGHIVFEVDAQPARLVWNTDKDSLEKIIFNLISNAVKYTPEGKSIRVVLRTGETLTMEVTNTGVGIPAEKQATIFDRYVVLDRFEQALSKGRTSNGIGLALCKSLAETLGGQMSLRSDGQSYTTFRLELPARQADEGQADIPAPDLEAAIPEYGEVEQKPAVRETDVLVVDDDRAIRSFIASILRDRFNILEAADGAEALEQVRRREPALVISDVVMSGMDGVEFLRRMKADEGTRHIPFILLSGKSSVENQIEGLENGADAYLAKPFHPRHLCAVIDNLLGRGQVLMDYGQSAQSAVRHLDGNIVSKEDKDLLTSITDIILRNMENDALSVDLIANEASLSRMQLYRKIKDLAGMTPTEYIRHLRLEHAEHLLKTTSRTVQEIMFECGFSSKTYFYREFDKKYSMTPKEYREQATREA